MAIKLEAPLSEIKKELLHLPTADLIQIILRCAKYKKEVKELIHFELYYAQQPQGFLNTIFASLDQEFVNIATQKNIYFLKKSLRKILRIVNRYAKFLPTSENQILLYCYFCQKVFDLKLNLQQSTALYNMVSSQLEKVQKLISKLHPDYWKDYTDTITKLQQQLHTHLTA